MQKRRLKREKHANEIRMRNNLFCMMFCFDDPAYGRIMTEVLLYRPYSEVRALDRAQDSPTQIDLAQLIDCLLYGN